MKRTNVAAHLTRIEILAEYSAPIFPDEFPDFQSAPLFIDDATPASRGEETPVSLPVSVSLELFEGGAGAAATRGTNRKYGPAACLLTVLTNKSA